MASEYNRLAQKYNSIACRFNEHIYKFVAVAGTEVGYNAARGWLNDLIDFHNQQCKINDQCLHRTGREIDVYRENYERHYALLDKWKAFYNIESEIL